MLPQFHAGHMPALCEWFALPMLARAGARRASDAAFDAIFHLLSEQLVARCGAVSRLGAASQRADHMVASAQAHGRRIFHSLHEIRGCA